MGIFRSGACTACSHRERSKIDALLASGAGIVEVASRFGLSKSALGRHCQRHLAHGLSDESAVAVKQLIDSTQRALYRAERKGDERTVMDCLRLLTSLRTQSRIISASASSASAPAVEQLPEGKDPDDLVRTLKSIYGIGDRKYRAEVFEHQWSSDERLLEQLRAFVEKRANVAATSAAIATRLASRILNRPLDEKTELEVTRLEVAEEADAQEMVGEADGGEGIDTGPSDRGDERHVDNPDVDNND